MPEVAAPLHTQALVIRPAIPEEAVLIERSWKSSFWHESLWAKRVSWQVFTRGHQKIIWNLLARSTVLVACAAEHPEEHLGLGYIVFEPGQLHDGDFRLAPPAVIKAPALHYVWVREHERGKGVARALFGASFLPRDLAGVAITHPTRAWFSDLSTAKVARHYRGIDRHFPQAVYDPYRWLEVP